MSYFICKRAFRDAKGPIPAGSIIDPAEIKRFRFRLQERHIVEVTEHNFEKYDTFFKQRYNIEIPSLEAKPKKEAKPVVEAKPVEEAKPKKEAKPVVKATAAKKARVTK